MKRLITHSAVVYDANCFIYYCFYSSFSHEGKEITVSFPVLTDKMRAITEGLCKEAKLVFTTDGVFQEIQQGDKVARIIRSFTNRPEVREQLHISNLEMVPAILEFRLIRSLDKKIRGLQGKDWLKIESFIPDKTGIEAVKKFYESLIADPRMIKLCQDKHRTKTHPSNNDMSLILYTKQKQVPFLTNDRDFIDFREEIERDGFCVKVVPVKEVEL